MKSNQLNKPRKTLQLAHYQPRYFLVLNQLFMGKKSILENKLKRSSHYLKLLLNLVVVQISKSTTWTERVMTNFSFSPNHRILQKDCPSITYCSLFLFPHVFENDKLSFTLR